MHRSVQLFSLWPLVATSVLVTVLTPLLTPPAAQTIELRRAGGGA
jgi:hypothetical protein